MRRALALVPLLALTACPHDTNPPGTTTATAPPATTATAPATTPSPFGWTQEAGDIARTASSTEKGPQALPGIAWSNPVAAEVVSEPVFGIAGGKNAVLMTSDKSVIAFDLENGQTVWSRETPSSLNASPIVAGGHVWQMAMDNLALQLDPKDGAIQKQFDIDFTLQASPLLAGGVLVYEETSMSAQVPQSRLHGVDPVTGAEKWHVDFLKAAGRAPSSDGTRAFAASNDGILAINLADGSKAWQHPFPVVVRMYSPIVVGDAVIASGGSYTPGFVAALDAKTGEQRWNVTLSARIGAACAIAGDELLVPEMDSKIHRLSLKDGKEVGTLDPGGRSDARPVVSATRIYVPVGQTVVAFDRSTFAESWRIELEDVHVSDAGISSMAIIGSKLIVARLDGHVHALEAPGGA